TLLLGRTLLGLPFQIFSTFVLEEHFGFNRTTGRIFAIDLVKSLILTVVLGGPLVAAVLWLFERAGNAAWLYCWMVSSVFLLVLIVAFPRWIMPLFNRFEPLGEGELRDAISAYAENTGFALADVFVIDGSRRSSRSNAFFTGFGRTKRIALYDTLVENHSVKELVAILAHEVGHYAKGHIKKGLILSILHNGLVFFLLSIVLDHRGLFEAFKMQHMSIYAGLVFFALLYSPVELILSLFLNLMARKHEFEADRFAAETTGTPAAMISALKKLSADNLSNLTPHPFYVFLNHSHPPLSQRVAALRGLGTASA
ncbi:MAG: M48 family metallopeptidase, partial [Thermoanaerobaculia bacterium]